MIPPTVISLKSNQRALVVGHLNGNVRKLQQASYLGSDYDWLVLNGGAFSSDNSSSELLTRLDLLQQIPRMTYVLGRSDYLAWEKINCPKLLAWLETQANLAILSFPSREVLIMDGGLTNGLSKQQLENNPEISFISQIDNKPWHQSYNGGLGYAISNNPLTNYPKHWKHSLQLGSDQAQVFVQEVDGIGLKRILTL
jgi:hypothetical protein